MTITDKYVFFWGSIYSQWAIAPMQIDGRTYNCCEQYMMHRKALLFEDFETAKKIMDTGSPFHQKGLGRQVKNFNQAAWEAIARDVVFQANLAKFTQNKHLMAQMLSTGDRLFVEASPTDKIWGIGLSDTDPRIHDPAQWQGTNWLGEALDSVKAVLSKANT